MFIYEDYKKKISNKINSIIKTKKGYGKLKKILVILYKNYYIKDNPQLINCKTKKGKKEVLKIAQLFNKDKLITQSTIISRGWSDRLIKKYVTVDVYAVNPHYKNSFKMKLYSLSKILTLEQINSDLSREINKIILRRERKLKLEYQLEKEREERIVNGAWSWVQLFQDKEVAIAFLFRFLNVFVPKSENIYSSSLIKKASFLSYIYDNTSKLHWIFDVWASHYLRDLYDKGYKIKTCISSFDPENSHPCDDKFIHWFSVKGYDFYCFNDIVRLGINYKQKSKKHQFLSIEKYQDNLSRFDKYLFFKLTGWQDISEALEGQFFLYVNDNINSYRRHDSKILDLFTKQKYPIPPTDNELFLIQLHNEKKQMFKKFSYEIKKLQDYAEKGCPLGYVCSYMGAINEFYCRNYRNCLFGKSSIESVR